ncbi:carboxymuconolactone decarboxylase family protein [Nitrospinota bacterium]
MTHNTALGQAAGITDEQLEAIASDDYMESPHLSPRERAAVLWAEHFTRNTIRERPDVFEEARKHFSDAELVELSLMSGKQGSSNRLMDSFQIPIEEEADVNKIKKSVRVNPDKMKAYLETLLANWPSEFPEPDSAAPGAQ